MVNKKGESYRQIFCELKQLASERQKSFSPQLIVTDFESGVLPVVKTDVQALFLTKNIFRLTRVFILVSSINKLWMSFPL